MSNTIVLVCLVLFVVLAIAAFRFLEKKKEEKAIAAAAAKAAAAHAREMQESWNDLNEVVRVLANELHWLAREAGLNDLHRGLNAGTVANIRLGQVSSSNMSSHNGLGIYLSIDGQEVAYGIKYSANGRVCLLSGVCRIYGE
jgi:hypothetical protein